MKKLLQITALIIFIAGIHLAGCDSGNMAWFLWSKVVGACLMGLLALIFIAEGKHDGKRT